MALSLSANQCNIHTFFGLASVALFVYSNFPVLILTCESVGGTLALQPNATATTETGIVIDTVNIDMYSYTFFVHLYSTVN